MADNRTKEELAQELEKITKENESLKTQLDEANANKPAAVSTGLSMRSLEFTNERL